MKGKRILLSVIFMAIIVALALSTNAYAANSATQRVLNINRTIGNATYKINGNPVFKIVSKDDPLTTSSFYCLKGGIGFGSDENTISDERYTTRTDMKISNLNTIASKLDLGYNYNNVKSVLWILDNIYLPKEDIKYTDENGNPYIKKMLLNQAANYYSYTTGREIDMSALMEDDNAIEIVQQCALWYFTNPESDYQVNSLSTLRITIGGNEGGVADSWAWGQSKYDAAEALYQYLIAGGRDAATNYEEVQNPLQMSIAKGDTFNVSKIQSVNKGNTYRMGPITLTKTGDISNLVFNFKVTDQNNNEIYYNDYTMAGSSYSSYKITDYNGNEMNKNDIIGKTFYINVTDSNMNSIKGIRISMDYTNLNTVKTLWSKDGEQPVAEVQREVTTGNHGIEIRIPEFDLSLRKNIVSVTRGTETIYIDRTPTIITDNLKTATNGKTGSTAEYKHRKDPVSVQTGDIVEYAITIYNEGEIAGRATEIIDYLPDGLKYVNGSGDSNYNFAYDANTHKITITPKNSTNLNPYNGGITLDSVQIKFKCEVEKVVGNGKSETLTNIAEITRSHNDYGFDDRDSTPNNLQMPADLSSYRGKNNNKTDLTDSSYFYQGQEDDDDFEKLIVTTPQFDLSLRKYIISVTRNGVKQNIAELGGREPNINTNTLAGGTTAEYIHRKDPVTVQTGDLVEYAITIYNEGDVAGRATEIIDYLPDGLVFSTANTTNYDITVSENKRIITIKAKEGYKHNLSAYEGGATLASETITFTCEVTKKQDKKISGDTILTNIAEITEAYNYKDEKMYLAGDDRDSEPKNVNLPTDTNLPSYKGNSKNKDNLSDPLYFYEGQQDDDDFEKLKVITLEYDMALRKFITQIDGEEVEESREPEVDTTPLKDKTGTTAIYKHSKKPVVVNLGGTVTYTIRVYNEGEVDACVGVIEDYLPEGLELVPAQKSTINAKYGWNVTTDGRVVTTEYLKNTVIKAYDGGDDLYYADVEIECKIKETASYGEILTNIAQINSDNGDDRDSTPGNRPVISDKDLPGYEEHHEDDDDYEKVVIYTPGYDLALRKFITKVNDVEVNPSREPKVNTAKLKDETATTAIYTHSKTPIVVNLGDTITYTIRVYNEGEENAKATIIEDYLPEELELVSKEESAINAMYDWDITTDGRIVTTDYLKDTVIKAYDGGDDLYYADVEIECKIKSSAKAGKILTNIAQINGDDGDDRDSTPGNVQKPTDANLPNYEEHQEDDDDYEKIKIYQPNYDLALKKFITQVNEKEITDRIPVVDVSSLTDDSDATTAIYEHTKTPIIVKNGDTVVYTIRIYNEGEVDAYAEKIKDNIPEGLEFIVDNEINIEYRWQLSDDQKTVSSDYLSKDRFEENVIKAFDKDTMDTLDYKDVKIAFKVVEPNTSTRVITNIAEIKDDDGEDIDSTPNNDNDGEDDIDKEHIALRYFDLSLRKFITKVESKIGENLAIETDNGTDISREPTVEIDEDGNIKYIHPKDPVIVANSDIIIYTLRVYNEGTIDGYAEEIKDNVPVGLELVLDHEVNTKYDWVMYDEDGNITNDVTKAKTIRTAYLSEENGEDNMIKAFDRETMSTPDYKEVQVAFKVVEKNVGEERVVINIAEISKDSDDDEDSTPDNDDEDEDDIDKEYIKLKYFDLSLLKWVSKVSVTRNGETTVTETGFNGLENPEPLVKTEIKSSEIKSIIIKYEYGIKITNEGEIAGYAKEIADYIPVGLEFIPEDNPLWTLKEDGKIVTTQLENTLLQPGESAIVNVVFKWINNENNFGEIVNIAEISKDYNEKDAEDIDSTPDNTVNGEDDIDEAVVILNPKTGQMVIFIVLPTIILAILSTGIVLIKKYVL